MSYSITAEFDHDASVWFVAGSDVPGLAVEAETPAEMLALLRRVMPELVKENDDQNNVVFSLTFDHFVGKVDRGTG